MKREPNRSPHERLGIPRLQSWEGRQQLHQLAEYLWLAEQVTGVEATVLANPTGPTWRTRPCSRAPPAAAFGGHEFYVSLADKAAVLVCRLAWNHPLPDGNKRAAWAALVMFLDLNGASRDPNPPEVDDAETAALAIAAHDLDEAWTAEWLQAHPCFPGSR